MLFSFSLQERQKPQTVVNMHSTRNLSNSDNSAKEIDGSVVIKDELELVSHYIFTSITSGYFDNYEKNCKNQSDIFPVESNECKVKFDETKSPLDHSKCTNAGNEKNVTKIDNGIDTQMAVLRDNKIKMEEEDNFERTVKDTEYLETTITIDEHKVSIKTEPEICDDSITDRDNLHNAGVPQNAMQQNCSTGEGNFKNDVNNIDSHDAEKEEGRYYIVYNVTDPMLLEFFFAMC